jgi:hypothetical protein
MFRRTALLARKSVGPHGFTLMLDEKVLGVLGEAWGREDTEGGCTVILKWSRILLWISKPGQIATVELDMLGS